MELESEVYVKVNYDYRHKLLNTVLGILQLHNKRLL